MNAAISRLTDKLRDAEVVETDVFAEVICDACRRLPSMRRTSDFARLERLIESGAWIDAALALLSLEHPQWRLRQVVYDAGDWHCTLSRQRELPKWLDETVEACHPDLCLAILIALVTAAGESDFATEDGATDYASMDRSIDIPLCCENFT